MLSESNHVTIPVISEENKGQPLLDAVATLRANDTLAKSIATAGRHLAKEVLHPDNVDR